MAKNQNVVERAQEVWKIAAVWPLEKIQPYPNNPRTHPDDQIEDLVKIFQRHQIDQPIVVDEDGIILKGHGRLMAARKAGLKNFPVVQLTGLDDAEKRAIRISDNRVAEKSKWDQIKLRGEVIELNADGFDTKLLGFDDATLSWLSTGDVVVDPAGEWNGMPQFRQGDKTAFRSIVVHFKDQESVDKFAKVIKQRITEKTRFVWYPEREIKPFVKVKGAGK